MKWYQIKNLTCLKRGKFLNKARKKYVAAGKQPGRGGDRKSAAYFKERLRFDVYASSKTELSDATIRRSIANYRAIDKKCRKRLIGTWAEDNGTALAYIGRLTPENQRLVVDTIRDNPDMKNILDISTSVCTAFGNELVKCDIVNKDRTKFI